MYSEELLLNTELKRFITNHGKLTKLILIIVDNRIPYNPPKKRLYKIGTKSTINRTITAKINAPYSILL